MSAHEDYLRDLIDQAYDLTDEDYSAILDMAGPLTIGGYQLWPSDILKGLSDIGENGQTLATKGSKFDQSKAAYIEKITEDCKTQVNNEYEEEVIF